MPGMDTTAVDLLTRSEVWSTELKQTLQDRLDATKYVDWITGFPDGTQFTIPSVGDAVVREGAENVSGEYDSLDTGEFTFTIDKYPESKLYITDEARENAYYAAQLEASFIPKMNDAINRHLETNIWIAANSGQTVNNANTINGVCHRFVGSGNTNTTLAVNDFALAKAALDKALSFGPRYCIIDPMMEYYLNKEVGSQAFNYNPRFEGIVQEGFRAGEVPAFAYNLFGFDVYVSNFLPTPSDTAINAQDGRGSVSTPASSKCAFFMSMAPGGGGVLKGAWRRMPTVKSEYNKDLHREEYVATARYGLKLYRPESIVTVLAKGAL